ncbi:MAG TPA: amidohydrolase [Conexibacter sp.]|nr:amidohydrolase [Conexibacter sp.]
MSGPQLLTGEIVTMDPRRPRVEALALDGGRVVGWGSRAEAAAALPAGTAAQPLPGTVVPGLIDSHVHMLWGGRDRDRVELAGSASVAELLERIRVFAAQRPDDPWIVGSAGVDAERLEERRFPTRAELDEAAGGRPLFLDRRAHDALVNSAALAAAGIGRETPDPPGGVIERDSDGEATGLLVERPAAELVERLLPEATVADRMRWLRAIQPTFHAVGITSICDPALLPEEMLAYEASLAAGELKVRTTMMPLGDGEVDPAQRIAAFAAAGVDLDRDEPLLRVGPLKLFGDGGGSLATALLHAPWPGTDGYHGNLTTSREGLHAYAQWCAANGRGLGVHCVGDAAIDVVLDAYAAADAAHGPIAPLGFTLIHAYLWPSAEAIRRTRELGVLVATQAPLQWSFGRGLIERFGAEAIGRAHPFRSWLEAGVTVGGGSDGPGEALAPLFALWQMQARTVDGVDGPVGVQEAVSAEQALALYTTGAAAITGMPRTGRLAPGCEADLAVLDVDPLRAPPEACRDGRVLKTIVGGEVVHEI